MRLDKSLVIAVLAFGLFMSLPARAQNQVVLSEQFDDTNNDGLIDPAWQVTFATNQGATTPALTNGWIYDESVTQSSWLTVSEITSASVNTNTHRAVFLGQQFPPLGDFHVKMHISWDSSMDPMDQSVREKAVQFVTFTILDETGALDEFGGTGAIVRGVGYDDSWTLHSGSIAFSTPTESFTSGFGSLPLEGAAVVEVERLGDTVTFWWNHDELFSGVTSTAPADRIRIRIGDFELPPWRVGYPSHLGTLSIDYITVSGIAITQSVSEQLEAVIDDLETIITTNPGTPLADKLEDAKASLETALGELDKSPPDNQAAMGNIEGAVGDLEAAVNDGLLDLAQGTDLMEQLAGAARQLAETAINEAIARGGDAGDINDANQFLMEGDALRLAEAFKNAVSAYKDALAKAEGA